MRLFALLLTLLMTASATAQVSTTNPLGYDPTMVDALTMWDSAVTFELGTMEGVEIVDDHIALTPRSEEELRRNRRFPIQGNWRSPVVETEFDFTEFLPSWNPQAPERTGMRLDVRVRMAESGEWSPWLYIGRWGEIVTRPDRRVEFEHGTVNVDILNLDAPADAYELRTTFQCFDPIEQPIPTITRVAAVHSGSVDDEELRARLMPTPESLGEWAQTLEIPHLGQGTLGRPLSNQCCSPTSLTMVLQGLGEDIELRDCSMAVYDPDYNIFGNWGRNVAFAGSLGRDSWLTRFRNFDQVKALIGQGQPVIASITISEGDVTGLNYTGGHLVVIRGFTPEGDVVLNDPAWTENGDAVVWKADEMATVWFEHGGVGYVIQ